MIKHALKLSCGAFALALATPALAGDIAKPDAPEVDKLVDDHDKMDADTPTMDFGTWGFDPEGIDTSVDPGDDFFAYANAKWLAANPLPDEFSRFGVFNLLREKSTSDVKALVDELVARDGQLSEDEQRIVDAYNAYMDTDAIEAAGLAPTFPYIDQIAAATTLDKLARVWAMPGMPSMVGGGVGVDAKVPDQYTVYMGTGGMGLPDRDYYLDTSEKGREIQQKYRDYLTFLAREAGYTDPEGTAWAVYNLEDRVAREIAWDRSVRRNRDLTYNAYDRGELEAMAGDFPLGLMIDAMGVDNDKYVVGQVPPTAEEAEELGLDEATLAKIGKGVPGMFEMLADYNVATLQAWTILNLLSNNAAILPERFDQANFAFYGQTLQGTPEQRERWKRAIAEVEGHLGEQLGKSYAARYFPAENKAAMVDLVENLRKAYAMGIDEIEWMGEDTKKEALAKLAAFTPKIGYRDNFEEYEGLAIVGGDPLANRMASAQWSMADNVAKLGQPIDRTEWGMLPQTVNAYYSSTMNEIVFPAAILQQPFFGINADPAVNYGAIGGVIGHEMGHGFDDQGSKSDGTGALRNWWTDSDRANFEARTDALVAQYNAFCPYDDGETCVDGRFTLGENIGDLGGLSVAYRAYKLSLDGKEAPVIDGLTGDQRFFLAWAQVWRSQQRENNGRQRLRSDPHSPEEFRVNGVVRNMDEWYSAFNVTPEDDLYLPPEERVRIW
ncbi:zinc metalloprotease [Blastomonas marina]|uniref:Zinc metalloprotease n=1 Tax=Blastomonas marina TaxID=1867408 RepID=A0ABQ1F1Y6_9SPHN|nr:M13 family metallopeptidase [Blastomonas marina]GFZ96664.1 zinc metalloprotease [Blastomonas marina]